MNVPSSKQTHGRTNDSAGSRRSSDTGTAVISTLSASPPATYSWLFSTQFSVTIETMQKQLVWGLQVLVLLLLALLILSPVRLCAANSGESLKAFQQANQAYIELARDTSLRKDKPSWLAVVNAYGDVERRFPRSTWAPKAVYMQAKLYEQIYGYFGNKADLDAAIDSYEKVSQRYPDNSLADDALYKEARVYELRLKDKERAIGIYRNIVTKFPNGDMVQQAREALNSINVASADKLNVQSVPGMDKDQKTNQPSAPVSGLAQVREVRHWSDNDYTRIVINLSRSAAFETFTLPADEQAGRSERLVVDLNNTRIAKDLPRRMEVKSGLLDDIRISQNQLDKVRVVVDMGAKTTYKAFPLENPARIILDVSTKASDVKSTATKKRTTKEKVAHHGNGIKRVRKGAPSQVASDMPSIARQLSLKVSRIVIDPGHGGKDPGAIGLDGRKEKDITLEVSKLLARRLQAEGLDVFLTREKDTFVPLEERTAYANKHKADLFVSVHVNAHADEAIRGVETYILNLTSDASAIQVAARENATTSKSLSDLQFIINDLMLTSKINESSRFATSTQKSIISSLERSGHGGKDLGVKQAPFYVLMGAQMPSILVEIGFITNGTECTLMQNKEYQNSIIEGILSGINSYIDNTSYAFNNGRSS